MAEKPWRMFIGVWIAEPTREALTLLQQQLRLHNLPVRWVAEARLHLTLHFLGDVAPELVPELQAAISLNIADCMAPWLELHKPGAFPNQRRPRVLWAGSDQLPPALEQLHQALGQALTSVGVPLERRAYHPHVTLGYVQRDVTVQGLARCHDALDAVNRSWSAAGARYEADLRLVRSILKPAGPEYHPVQSWILPEPA